jgi:NAD(P)-dependent dehydrogenase (short-subunit alcohol dehydrogenase family)
MAGVQIAGSTILLTGASSGIGRELAKEMSARGARLAISARRAPLLETLAGETVAAGHPMPVVIPADLSRRDAARTLAAEAENALGPIDILVNNAGGGVGGRIPAVGDRDEAREAFETNYWSPLALISALTPGMQQRGKGAVVNVTSMAQVSTWPRPRRRSASRPKRLRWSWWTPGSTSWRSSPDRSTQPSRARHGLRRASTGCCRGLRLVTPPIGYILPALARWDTRRLAARTARETDSATREALDSLVVRTGSMGDEITRQARDAWERERGREATSVRD